MRKREKKHIIESSQIIPMVDGKREWNVYDVPNSILHHTSENGVHPTIVLIEYDGKVLLVELTHSKKGMKTEILNPNEHDKERSYMKRKTVVTRGKGKREAITIKDLKDKRNTRRFTKEEKQKILDSLNSKNHNITNFKILLTLNKKKPKK